MRKLCVTIPALALGAALTATPALAVNNYDDCVKLVKSDPAKADAAAAKWASDGNGGAAAQHCRALALLAEGLKQPAATLLTSIAARDRELPNQVRAEIMLEAGRIYLDLADLKAGHKAVDEAMKLAKDKRPVLVLSAQLKAAANDWQGAAADLSKALDKGKPDADILVLRASARLHMRDLVGARADLAWAEELAPKDPTLWLEKGNLAEAAGKRDAAQAAWLKAIELDQKGGAVAQAARLRLQKMAAGTG